MKGVVKISADQGGKKPTCEARMSINRRPEQRARRKYQPRKCGSEQVAKALNAGKEAGWVTAGV